MSTMKLQYGWPPLFHCFCFISMIHLICFYYTCVKLNSTQSINQNYCRFFIHQRWCCWNFHRFISSRELLSGLHNWSVRYFRLPGHSVGSKYDFWDIVGFFKGKIQSLLDYSQLNIFLTMIFMHHITCYNMYSSGHNISTCLLPIWSPTKANISDLCCPQADIFWHMRM